MRWEDIAVNVLGSLISVAVLGFIGDLSRARSSEPELLAKVYAGVQYTDGIEVRSEGGTV